MATVRLKLLIDTKQKKVLFAEAGKDFVDFLFTLLSFPAGTIIRLLSKDNMVGSLGKLYESVENFSDTFMQPNLNKDVLLKPKEPGAVPNNLGLLTNIEKPERKVTYVCSYTNQLRLYGCNYFSDIHPYCSDDPKAKCPKCRNFLSCATTYVAPPTPTPAKAPSSPKEIGFVKPVVTYMIMDDLEVKPMSTISTIALLNRFNVRDFGALEEKVVGLGMDEMGSTGEKIDLESDEEIPFRSSAATNKVEALDFEMVHLPARPAMAKSWIAGHIGIRAVRSIYTVLLKAKINILLPFGPLAILLHYVTGKHGWVFFFSLLGIIPLAERLGYATEQLAFYTGPTVGGLLNATFGNATEMIISIYALKNGMIRVVQQSLLGSILSNMLLVLGCAFFTGGIIHYEKVQEFNKSAAVVNSGLLLMAVMGILFPAVLHFTHTEVHFGKSELALSRFSSCIMLVAYASYLFFQLRSHRSLYNPIDEEGSNGEDSDEEEIPEITHWEAICWLSVLTVWVSILSGYLVDAIQGASDSFNMPVAFISVILLPIVGNAAEHASAIMFAMKDKLDITLGVAIGSSTQISMFVIPFCVVVGWIMGVKMDLNFQLFETATLFITVLVVAFMLQEGTSNYFKGLMLILCYLIVAASFFVHVDHSNDDD